VLAPLFLPPTPHFSPAARPKTMSGGKKKGIQGPKHGGPVAFAANARTVAVADHHANSDNDSDNPNDGDDGDGTRFALYQRAVQNPAGDLGWALRFHRMYGRQANGAAEPAPPLHLREDFCGTALLTAAWLRGSPLRTGVGIDLDGAALRWGAQHNFAARGVDSRACLVRANVLDDVKEVDEGRVVLGRRRGQREEEDDDEEEAAETAAPVADLRRRRADLILTLNYSLCLLYTRADAVRYLRHALAALKEGEPSAAAGDDDDDNEKESTGILMLDLLGGHTAERAGLVLARRNLSTGARFRWEQARYDPLARRLRSHLRLLGEGKGAAGGGKGGKGGAEPVATFTYDWRLWTLPDAIELLREAGHSGDVRVWVRRMREDDGGRTVRREEEGSSASEEEEDQEEEKEEEGEEYVEYRPGGTGCDLPGLAEGWSAYVVAVVVRPR